MAHGPALIERGRLNPGYLKLDLFCRGLRLAPDCDLGGRQGAKRVRAGLGSGIEMRIEGAGGMTVNAPVLEPFAEGSPYELRGPDARGRHAIHADGRAIATVTLPHEPRFHAQTTSSGKPMGSVGTLQGTYLGVYYGQLCANWKRPDEDACRFCAVGTHVGHGDERTDKSPEDVVETALAAAEECGITFVHLNGGFDDRGAYIDRFGPVVEALRRETGLLVGVQIPPLEDFHDYHRLRAMGVNNLSLCFELWDGERFREVCPGKSRRAGLQRYLDAIRLCAGEVGFETTNGELIAGLEEPTRSIEAIDWLTEQGAVPTVCVFRPLAGTAYEGRPPPETESLVPVFAHLYRRCMEAGLPIGVAPGLHVSIVLTPDECRWLLPPGERAGWRLRRLKHATMRRALAGLVARRRRAAARRRRTG
ncbi:MAG: radical SAM protein [Planctomycetota bacterium]|nr:radical SAM protein [Planctomycetota bacterium]